MAATDVRVRVRRVVVQIPASRAAAGSIAVIAPEPGNAPAGVGRLLHGQTLCHQVKSASSSVIGLLLIDLISHYTVSHNTHN